MADREAARWRKRRIIYNNDGDDVVVAKTENNIKAGLMARGDGELIDDFLNARSVPLLGTEVDSIWYATCFSGLTFTHQTKLGGFHDKWIGRELIDRYGRDNLQIQIDFGHEHDMEVFWSLRMNDTHDAWPSGSHHQVDGLAPFKQTHPEFLLKKPDAASDHAGAGERSWSAVDFSHPGVREHIFSLIQEVCDGYDVDGVELDFLRSFPYFPESRDWRAVGEQHREAMTDLVRRVWQMAGEVSRKRGRPLLVAARTPFSVADARFVGLDVECWLEEGLIDLWVPGGLQESIMTESFVEMVELGHKHGVPVYPCIGWGFWQHWAFLDDGANEHRTREAWIEALRSEHTPYYVALNSWDGMMPSWRGAATNLWNANPDGIYVFNGFHRASIQAYREIGDLETLAGKEKLFGVDRFAGDSSFEDLRELELEQGKPVGARFQLGEDLTTGSSPELRFRVHLWDAGEGDEIEVKLNGASLDDLKPAGATQAGSQWLECRLDPDRVKKGPNEVELLASKRDESMQTPLVWDSAQLHVSYTH